MARIEHYIATAIAAIPEWVEYDVPSMLDLADGGVYTQRIDREKTPGAFHEQPPNLPRRSVAVVGGTEQGDKVKGLSLANLTVWVRWADNVEDGLAAAQIMAQILRTLPNNVYGEVGNCGMVEFVDRFEQPDPVISGGRMCYLRFRVAGLLTGSGGI
jgi:hypothetical protein